MKKLITLSSPIAIRTTANETRLVNVVEVTDVFQKSSESRVLTVVRWFCTTTQKMVEATLRVEVKATNIRSTQEVA